MSILIIIAKIAFVFIMFCIGVVMGAKATCHKLLEHLEIALHDSNLTDEQRLEIVSKMLESADEDQKKSKK